MKNFIKNMNSYQSNKIKNMLTGNFATIKTELLLGRKTCYFHFVFFYDFGDCLSHTW